MPVRRIEQVRLNGILVKVIPDRDQALIRVEWVAGNQTGEEVLERCPRIAEIVDLEREIADRPAGGDAGRKHVWTLLEVERGDQTALRRTNEIDLGRRTFFALEDIHE